MKLSEHFKNLQDKQEEIMKKHNSLLVEYDELEHLKNNMNEYMGRNKTEKKKESVIGSIKKHRSEEREISKEKNKISKEAERQVYCRCGLRTAPALFIWGIQANYERTQEVEIFVNFIGKFEMPKKEPVKEELEELEKLRKKREKKREYNYRYMRKLKEMINDRSLLTK